MAEAPDGKLVSVMLNDDARFVFPEGDWFWTRHIGRGFYEPEIEAVLRRAAARPYGLIDAGANFGYWSIVASSAPYGRHPAVAIEASRDNFRRLVHNAQANGGRFHTLHRAVLDVSGRQVRLFGRKHYGLSLRPDWHPDDADQAETVESVTLDQVADDYLADRTHPPLLKVDVEGVEIEAMRGARRLIEEGALVIYEDHGKEASHRISRYVLSLEAVALWHIGKDGRSSPVGAVEELDAIKQNPKLGYNFFFHRRASPWAAVFEA